MSSAIERALNIVEILRLILSHVDAGETLFRCSLVSKHWSSEAIAILWRGALRDTTQHVGPTVYDLYQLIKKTPRLPEYIGRIRYLEIDFSHPGYEFPRSWSALSKPVLWKHAVYQYLSVDLGMNHPNESRMARLLHHGLLILNLVGGSCSDQFLENLEVSRMLYAASR